MNKAPADVTLVRVSLFIVFVRQLQHVLSMTNVVTGEIDALVCVVALQRGVAVVVCLLWWQCACYETGFSMDVGNIYQPAVLFK